MKLTLILAVVLACLAVMLGAPVYADGLRRGLLLDGAIVLAFAAWLGVVTIALRVLDVRLAKLPEPTRWLALPTVSFPQPPARA